MRQRGSAFIQEAQDGRQFLVGEPAENPVELSSQRYEQGFDPAAHCGGERRYDYDPATVAEDLTQADLHLVGNYAVSMTFSDGHHTGIYTFGLLRRLSPGGA